MARVKMPRVMSLAESREVFSRESREIKKEVVEKLAALVTAAFGLIAALAWNDAIKTLFAEGGPLHFLAAGGMWIYAIAVTFLAVVLTIWIGRVSQKFNPKPSEPEKK